MFNRPMKGNSHLSVVIRQHTCALSRQTSLPMSLRELVALSAAEPIADAVVHKDLDREDTEKTGVPSAKLFSFLGSPSKFQTYRLKHTSLHL